MCAPRPTERDEPGHSIVLVWLKEVIVGPGGTVALGVLEIVKGSAIRSPRGADYCIYPKLCCRRRH
jgi:hypothetical protein